MPKPGTGSHHARKTSPQNSAAELLRGSRTMGARSLLRSAHTCSAKSPRRDRFPFTSLASFSAMRMYLPVPTGGPRSSRPSRTLSSFYEVTGPPQTSSQRGPSSLVKASLGLSPLREQPLPAPRTAAAASLRVFEMKPCLLCSMAMLWRMATAFAVLIKRGRDPCISMYRAGYLVMNQRDHNTAYRRSKSLRTAS